MDQRRTAAMDADRDQCPRAVVDIPVVAHTLAIEEMQRSVFAPHRVQELDDRVIVRIDPHLRVEAELGSGKAVDLRSEEHTSELQSLMRISYAVVCLKKKKEPYIPHHTNVQKYIT